MLRNFLARLFVCTLLVAVVWGFTAPIPKTDLAGATVLLEVSGKGHGSGVYIGNGVVLTAAHVAAMDDLELVTDKGERLKTEVLWLNKDYDVAALAVSPDAKIQVAELSCRMPRVGEEITSSGNPEDYTWIKTYGTIAGKPIQIKGTWRLVSPVSGPIIPGMSGGPSFSPTGKIIGINVGVSVSHIGMYGVTFNGLGFIVPAKVICMFMGRR